MRRGTSSQVPAERKAIRACEMQRNVLGRGQHAVETREAGQHRVRFALGYDGRAAEETWGGDKAGGVLFVGDVGQ